MARLKAAFMFVSPDADPGEHRATISTPDTVELIVVGVKDYQQGMCLAPLHNHPSHCSSRLI